MHHVFVYGSLQRDQFNHRYLYGASFLGRNYLAGARLHSLGSYPMAVLDPDPGAVIHGEVYRVDPQGLALLDQLEGHPDFYERQLITLANGQQAWVYLGEEEKVVDREPVPFGSWGTTPVLSYGSNMNPERLESRCRGWDGNAVVARLEGWRWGINKLASSGSGRGCAGITPEEGAHCWGVVHHLSPEDLAVLDSYEGVGFGHYRHEMVRVATREGYSFEVLTYVPEDKALAEGLLPEPSYADHILIGAEHYGLPSDWRKRLQASLVITA
ncbi:MAG: gamma-glutamylcyclotransferase [Synechococcus sp.]|nr:gamma-glutamylcyclotransferase [Synechococcus sp.]